MNVSIFKTSELHIVLHESFFNYLFAQTDDDDADNDNYKHTKQATLFLIATTKFHVFMYFIIFHLSQVKTRCIMSFSQVHCMDANITMKMKLLKLFLEKIKYCKEIIAEE